MTDPISSQQHHWYNNQTYKITKPMCSNHSAQWEASLPTALVVGDITTLTPNTYSTISLTNVQPLTNLEKNACRTTQKYRYCPNLDRSRKTASFVTGTTCNRNCTGIRFNLIYAMSCITGKIQYVGQKQWTKLECFQEHYANTNKAIKAAEKNP